MSVNMQRRGPVLVVTIDRPQVCNAVDRPTADLLDRAFQEFDDDPDLCVAVLTGAGGTFCAGADLHAYADPDRANRLEPSDAGPMGPTRRVPRKPVVAAVEGHAVAGGLELALWCDLRVVAASAVLGVFCRRIGVPLIDGGTVRLPRIVGLGRALDLILTGRPVSSDEAERIGLATTVVADGSALDEAVALGRQLSALPQTAMRSDLAAARAAFDRPLDEALLEEHRIGAATIAAGAPTDGVHRFRTGEGRGGADLPRP